eukprot:3986527-Pyramimonas_sp.AAC.1
MSLGARFTTLTRPKAARSVSTWPRPPPAMCQHRTTRHNRAPRRVTHARVQKTLIVVRVLLSPRGVGSAGHAHLGPCGDGVCVEALPDSGGGEHSAVGVALVAQVGERGGDRPQLLGVPVERLEHPHQLPAPQGVAHAPRISVSKNNTMFKSRNSSIVVSTYKPTKVLRVLKVLRLKATAIRN